MCSYSHGPSQNQLESVLHLADFPYESLHSFYIVYENCFSQILLGQLPLILGLCVVFIVKDPQINGTNRIYRHVCVCVYISLLRVGRRSEMVMNMARSHCIHV